MRNFLCSAFYYSISVLMRFIPSAFPISVSVSIEKFISPESQSEMTVVLLPYMKFYENL